MRRRVTLASALAPLIAGSIGSVAESAKPARVSASTPTAAAPPELTALEQKMKQLQVNSERFSQTLFASGTRHVGKHRRRIKRVSVTQTEGGEVSLAPLEGKVFKNGDQSKPTAIAIGSTLYSYSPSIAGKDRGRPWIELTGLSAAILFPFHGDPSEEVNAGGTGSYAGLINLLDTATGNVDLVGPSQVDGQQTTEFAAVVNPVALIKGVPKKELEKHQLSERLTVFLTDAGLPVRVGTYMHVGPVAVAETTDILALNIPVNVTPPPLSQTIDEAEFLKLLRGKRTRGGTGFSLEPPG
jgi:hypothetical protein